MTTYTKLLSIGVIGLTTAYSQAAIIWGVAQNITNVGDDVLTIGTTHAAVNASENDQTDVTLNTVVFQSGDINSALNVSTAGFLDSNTANLNPNNLAGLDTDQAEYNRFLGDIDFGEGSSDISIDNLVVGNTYQVQVWFVDNRIGSGGANTGNDGRVTTITNSDGSSSVALNDQFAIGTFVADGSSEIFNVTTSGASPNLTGFQVRDLGVIPEPSSTLLSGVGLLALLARRRR